MSSHSCQVSLFLQAVTRLHWRLIRQSVKTKQKQLCSELYQQMSNSFHNIIFCSIIFCLWQGVLLKCQTRLVMIRQRCKLSYFLILNGSVIQIISIPPTATCLCQMHQIVSQCQVLHKYQQGKRKCSLQVWQLGWPCQVRTTRTTRTTRGVEPPQTPQTLEEQYHQNHQDHQNHQNHLDHQNHQNHESRRATEGDRWHLWVPVTR